MPLISSPSAPAPPPLPEKELGPLTQELDRSLVKGLAWTGSMRWAAQLISWLAALVVARLLTPEDYGLFGMATLFIGLVTLFSEFGVGGAIVYMREVTEEQTRQLNTLCVAIGVVAFLAGCLCALPLGYFFRAPRLPAVVLGLSGAFVISSFRTVPYALLQRALSFRLISLLDVSQIIAQSVTTVALAAIGFGYWSLVIGSLIGVAILSGLSVWCRGKGFAVPRTDVIRSAFTLSSHILVQRVTWFVYSNSDFLIAGRVLGEHPLGIYSFAWILANQPVDKVASVVGQVTPAVFSAAQNDQAALTRYVCRITEGMAAVTLPAAIGIALVADDLVAVTLGQRWLDVVAPLRVLAAFLSVRSIVTIVPQVLNVVGESRFAMKLGVWTALALPCAFLIGSRWGILGIASTWAIAYPFVAAPSYWRLFHRIHLPIRRYLKMLEPAVVGTLLMTLVVLAVRFVGRDTPPAVRLGTTMLAGAGAYTMVLGVAYRPRVRALRELVRSAPM